MLYENRALIGPEFLQREGWRTRLGRVDFRGGPGATLREAQCICTDTDLMVLNLVEKFTN
jgi:hypothetical protein